MPASDLSAPVREHEDRSIVFGPVNVVEQRASIAVVLSMFVLALGMAVHDEGDTEPAGPDLISDPSLFVESVADEPLTLLEVRLAGASLLGVPHVILPGGRLTLSVVDAHDGVRPPWRVRWLYGGRVHHTSWSGGWARLAIAGPHATTPPQPSCVMGGGTQVVRAWHPAHVPHREVTDEPSDFVQPASALADFK